jgi:hypothetical protein
MKGFRASLLVVSLFLLPVSVIGQASSQPSVTNTMPSNDFGFNLPTHLGTLSYSLTGSELVGTGYGDGSFASSTVLSGDLAYLSDSENAPFSMVYSGGYLYSTIPGTPSSSTFQNLALSQVYKTRAWVFVASDAVSYLPESPTTGLSGIAGVGDVGTFPVQTGLGPSQSILTDYSRRVSNGLQGSATWQVTPSLEFEGSGSWNVLHFLDTDLGLDSSEYDGSFGPSYRIDARNQLGTSAYYSYVTYPNYAGYKIESEGINLNYTRAWSRRLSTTVSLGPELTHGQTLEPLPSSVNFAGTASATYATRTTGLYASYSRGVNAGSGVVFGSLSDTVTAGMNRPINRNWILGINGGYSHNKDLVTYAGEPPIFSDAFGTFQVSRRISESLSAYGSYTAIDQSIQNLPGTSNAFNGLNHTFSVGITFAPQPLIRGR